MCDHINGVLVASGVDEQGEWQSLECEDCGKTWVERSNNMKVNGYEIDRVSDEEFAVYKAIRRRLNAEWIAEVIRFYDHDGDALTQEEFERLVTHYENVWRDYTDDGEDVCLEWAFDDIIEERNER